MTYPLALSVLLFAASPVPREGTTCPPRYIRTGPYCTPYQGAHDAVKKEGQTCPPGFYSTGPYCTRF